MAHIVPFRALRPTPEAANQVASVPYDVVNRKEAAELAFDNPLSFLTLCQSPLILRNRRPAKTATTARPTDSPIQ